MKTNNRIYWRELLYQQRAVPRSLQILDSVGIVTITLLLASFLVWLVLQGLQHPYSNYIMDFNLMAWGQLISWFIHSVAVGRAILSGVAIIHRDGNSQHWDALKLTNLSALQFLFGKWQAAFFRVRSWILSLGIIQLALIGVLINSYLLIIHKQAIQICYYELSRFPGEAITNYCALDRNFFLQNWQKWGPLFVPVSVAAAIAFSILEIAASTAIGVAGRILLRGNWFAMLFALSTRFFPVILFSLWPNYYSSLYSIPQRDIWAFRWYEYTWFSIADGGTSAILRMAVTPGWFGTSEYGRPVGGIVLALIAGAGMLMLLFAGAMVMGWLVLKSEGFSAQAKR